ncbi:MAG: hypothetical protein ACJ73S_02035 [Mycobacteriales bacterium]
MGRRKRTARARNQPRGHGLAGRTRRRRLTTTIPDPAPRTARRGPGSGPDLPVEEIARRVGYRDAAVLREQFASRRGVPLRAYRCTFTRAAGPPARGAGTSPTAAYPW